jgi:hypothetical protein
MPINAKSKMPRLTEIPCAECNLLTRQDTDRCLHCNATLAQSSRARPSPREAGKETVRRRVP